VQPCGRLDVSAPRQADEDDWGPIDFTEFDPEHADPGDPLDELEDEAKDDADVNPSGS
jgi:hypothetical protein